MKQIRSLRAAPAALCAAALVCAALWPAARSGAAHDGPTHKFNRTGWTVLAPVTYKNLTLFPVRGRDLAPAGDYLTLDEGIKNGTVLITEKGARAVARRRMGRQAPGAAQQQVAMNSAGVEGATVNELALVNRSGRKLLLLSGEVVVGGKQDRIVQDDLIIPPVSVPVSLNVFCVEHGRWSQRASHTSSGGGAAPVVAAAPDGFTSLGAISHPKLRAAAQDKKQQGEVWKEVSENNQKLGTQTGTDTYQEVYANRKVAAQLDDYVRTLEREVLQPGAVGVVVARNGQLVWADVFASSSLFARYWPKLLKSYAVDAMGDYTSDARPGTEAARRYLEERQGQTTVTGAAGVYQLVKTENPRYAVFELRDISVPTPLRLHCYTAFLPSSSLNIYCRAICFTFSRRSRRSTMKWSLAGASPPVSCSTSFSSTSNWSRSVMPWASRWPAERRRRTNSGSVRRPSKVRPPWRCERLTRYWTRSTSL
ncbi:MAG TPA: DUF6569 family protein [Pyrinomonadaceae bacterium]|nr:DUF6569 family protein [Pyrinomonadaceae bacterium]